jgi:desulfoferrodoxin (superoxide reductase-like protein)
MIELRRRDFLRFILVSATSGLCSLISLDRACADKSSVTIEAPATVTKGDEITITVTAFHDANNFFHYTDWLYIMVNDQEIARWDYTWRKRPEGKTFIKEITYTVTDPIEIKAEAHCNLHGSTGPKTLQISVNDP